MIRSCSKHGTWMGSCPVCAYEDDPLQFIEGFTYRVGELYSSEEAVRLIEEAQKILNNKLFQIAKEVVRARNQD